MVTVLAGRVRFTISRAAVAGAADDVAYLEGQAFGAEKVLPNRTSNTGGQSGVLVGDSYIPSSGSIVQDSTVQLSQNIVTASGDIIPAGSVVTESGGAIKIVTPTGVEVTGRTEDLLRQGQLALPAPNTAAETAANWEIQLTAVRFYLTDNLLSRRFKIFKILLRIPLLWMAL